jgi:hypothetical protein
LFPGDLDCFGDPFAIDPFFSGGFVARRFRSDSYINAAAAPSYGTEFSFAMSPEKQNPVTLLQLRDGSMYGLTRYWVAEGRLHYVTNYGGENSVPLDHIDLAMTRRLNAGRGTPFVLPDNSPGP